VVVVVFDVGLVESKPRVLGSERGYRVANVRLRQDATVGRGKRRPYKLREIVRTWGVAVLRPYMIEAVDKLVVRRMRVERV
jgi:hypothetical protein